MNSIQGGSGPIKKPASAGFNVIGSRDSVAYPFLSPHRLVGVLLRLITSFFVGVVLTPSNHYLVELAGVEPASEIPTSSVLHA